jgi:hypothetical protein
MVHINSDGVELERFIIFVSWSPPLAVAADKAEHAEAKRLLHGALQGVTAYMYLNANDKRQGGDHAQDLPRPGAGHAQGRLILVGAAWRRMGGKRQ